MGSRLTREPFSRVSSDQLFRIAPHFHDNIQNGGDTTMRTARVSRIATAIVCFVLLLVPGSRLARASAGDPLPSLTEPVNDFAHIIDATSAAEMDREIRALKDASGDVVVVVTVPTIEGYGDIREYANKLFQNNGRGIGEKGKDNGLLILLALKERRVWIEVGYDLEQWVTDGYAGETARDVMMPEFRRGLYGPGLLAGTTRIIGRIAQGRNVRLDGVEVRESRPQQGIALSFWWIVLIFIIILLIS